MKNTAGEPSLILRSEKRNLCSIQVSGCSRQRTQLIHSAAGDDHVFVYSTSTLASALCTKSSLDMFVSISYACGTAFSSWHLYSFCFLRLSRVKNANTPLARWESSRGSPAVFSHQLPPTLCRHYSRGLSKESLQKVRRLSLWHLNTLYLHRELVLSTEAAM